VIGDHMPPNKLMGGAKGAKDKLPAAVDNLPGISKVSCTAADAAAAGENACLTLCMELFVLAMQLLQQLLLVSRCHDVPVQLHVCSYVRVWSCGRLIG
jgi:hypothetical protein